MDPNLRTKKSQPRAVVFSGKDGDMDQSLPVVNSAKMKPTVKESLVSTKQTPVTVSSGVQPSSPTMAESSVPTVGGCYQIVLPEDWGTLNIWAEQRAVTQADQNKTGNDGYFRYVLRFGEPKSVPSDSDQTSDQYSLLPSSGHKQSSADSEAAVDYAKINWYEYSYDPKVLYHSGPHSQSSVSEANAAIQDSRDLVKQILFGHSNHDKGTG